MDHARYSAIAHAHHRYCNPLDPAVVDGVLERIGLTAGQRALDVGCGKAELLIRLAERFGVAGYGVDINETFLAEAVSEAKARGVEGLVTAKRRNASALPGELAQLDLTACIGSIHALGGYRATLRALREWTRVGGHVLVGEGYWRREPDAAYLAALEATRDEFTDHTRNIEIGREVGLDPVESHESTLADWDRYEGLYADTVERWAADHPSDPDAPAAQVRITRWRRIYRTWGRDTLGFGLYLFQRP